VNTLLITGASGFLGGHLCRLARERWDVDGTYLSHNSVPEGVAARKLNLAESVSVERLLEESDPAAVILAAVFQVDACQRDPDAADVINVESTGIFAEWCRQKNRRLIYLSSDMVFDGRAGMYTERDREDPINAYGRSKLAAERITIQNCPSACVVRLPLMYGFPVAGGTNFFHQMLRQLQDGKEVRVFHDQYRTPGLAENIARAILELAGKTLSGTIHVAGATRCNREEMARRACRLWDLDESLVRPVSMHDVAVTAPRPRDVSLDCALAREHLQTRLIGYEEGLQRLATGESSDPM
jgi:dTDP-4-dehydrorhamnose reductase